MRPRQACLGIRTIERHAAIGAPQASMRPRQACLGILPVRRAMKRAFRCFNEAEASLPRNTINVRYLMKFNWNVASMRPRQACLGIRTIERHAAIGAPQASMRPRQACLGILPVRRAMKRAFRCFNEAEASLPRNTINVRYLMKFNWNVASMRPRQACLGIPRRSLSNQYRTSQASMRPRQACLGIRLDGSRNVVFRTSFNEAEASLPRNTVSSILPPNCQIISLQ